MGNRLSMKLRRITANLPDSLLREARKATRRGITETLVEALELLVRQEGARKLAHLRGKVKLESDRGRSS